MPAQSLANPVTSRFSVDDYIFYPGSDTGGNAEKHKGKGTDDEAHGFHPGYQEMRPRGLDHLGELRGTRWGRRA